MRRHLRLRRNPVRDAHRAARAFHDATPADTIAAVLSEPASSLTFTPGTPPGLARIVRRCLGKNADERFQSARDLGFAIESMSDSRAAAESSGRGEVTSIAVLPFANLSADESNQYFSDGLAEKLINALTRISGLRVASPTSSFRFRGRDRDVREIGRELGAVAILEGSVRRAGTRLRITAQLTNSRSSSAHPEEALVGGERVVARARSTVYVGVLGLAYAYAGRIEDARKIARELKERAASGEYVVPAAILSVELGLQNADGVRDALAKCVDGGAAPFSVIATSRILIEPYRRDPAIAELVDRLYDGAQPPTEPPESARR